MGATLIAHCGGKKVTREDVNAVFTPPNGPGRYTPVDFNELLTLVEDMADSIVGLPVKSVEYALNRKQTQMFAAYTFDVPNSDAGLSIGVRSSHDKTLPVGIVGGSRVFVCDNLAFSGESMEVTRRHTTNVWNDVKASVANGVQASIKAHDLMAARWEKMSEVSLTEDDGYGILGRALGHDIIKPQQATRAFTGWGGEFGKKSPFPTHGGNLYGLYQAMTEGAKQGSVETRIDTLVDIDLFVRNTYKALMGLDKVEQLPGPVVEVTPEPVALEID